MTKINVLKRILCLISTDRRLRAASSSFFIASTSIALFGRFDDFIRTFVHVLILNVLCLVTNRSSHQIKFAGQGLLLGLVFGSTISIWLNYGSLTNPQTSMFCCYACLFAIFHFSEFFVTGLTNTADLKADSFLLNHSKEYWIAAVFSWTEFIIEALLLPSFYSTLISSTGILLCLVGEVLRKLAMCHASTGFTHQIALRRQKNHVLVTSGIYSLVRHPGYLGWLLWSVGTQMVLCNPICIIAYAYIGFNFLEERILEEEKFLIEFFGQNYVSYQQRVPSGLPGVTGFLIS